MFQNYHTLSALAKWGVGVGLTHLLIKISEFSKKSVQYIKPNTRYMEDWKVFAISSFNLFHKQLNPLRHNSINLTALYPPPELSNFIPQVGAILTRDWARSIDKNTSQFKLEKILH